jgi:Uncharacterized protein conserved in bacteria (DUF2213)
MDPIEKAFEHARLGTPARSPLRTMDNLATMPNAALPIAVRKRAKDAISGTTDMTPEDWRGLVGGLLEFFAEEADEPEHAADAAPKTLYVNRPLKNAAPFIEWAKAAGFAKTLTASDMHVTVAFSKAPIQWPEKLDNDVAASSGGRAIKQFGEGAIVLIFEAPDLVQRWNDLKGMGATWDHPTYQPHITITYEPGDVDISKVEPFTGPLEFGPEKFAEVDTGWKDKVKHTAGDETAREFESGIPQKGGGDSVAQDKMALDRASARSFDKDTGRMTVTVTNLSKANICPYRGDEIPGWDDETKTHVLGLDGDKVYMLLRAPEELKKSVPTWNGIQLLKAHKPVDINDHQKHDIVGTTGTNAEFADPYLRNSLVLWTKEGIDLIESGDQQELSCGYNYDPDMTPGIFNGEPYDGVMRNIRGNHVALVEEGRAGPDVMVADTVEQLQWAMIENAILEMGANA